MTNKVTFLKTLTVAGFKQEVNAEVLELKQNPKTSKLFLVNEAGVVVAGASSDATGTEPLVVSQIETAEGSKLWFMHKKGSGGAPTLKSF